MTYNYSYAQTLCKNHASPWAGRSATFDSAAEYFAVTSAMTGNIPGGGTNRAWIGLRNLQWDDPKTPSCPPYLDVTQFEAAANFTIPATGPVAVGSGWSTWSSPSVSVLDHLCEYGMKVKS